MVYANELKEGDYYFLLLFYPAKSEIPMIKTFIYVGKNLYAGEESSGDDWYFQEPRSYLEHGSLLQLKNDIKPEVFLANEDALSQMYDINGLIERLKKIK